MSEPRWIAEARKDIGLKEGAGAADNPRVVQMYRDAGCDWAKHDAIPWCAAAMGAWLRRAGLPNTKSLLAKSYATYGQKLAGPVVGAIGVMNRVGGGHVGIVVGSGNGLVTMLGGNQGDAVKIASFARSGFIAFRWPPGVPVPSAAAAPRVPAPKGRRKLSYHRGGRNA